MEKENGWYAIAVGITILLEQGEKKEKAEKIFGKIFDYMKEREKSNA